MMKSLVRSLVAIVYLLTNVCFAHAAQTSVWSERRGRAELQPKPAPQLASAVGLTTDMNAVLEATKPSRRSLEVTSPELPSSGSRSPLSLSLAAIPADAAQVRNLDVRPGTSHPAVVLIQDVHMNREAQENVATVLKSLQAAAPKGDHLSFGVEGAFAPFDFSAFQALPNPGLAERVARYFLRNNRVAASSYVGIASGCEGPRFYGVDDSARYHANVEALMASRRRQSDYNLQVEKAGRAIADEKRTSLNAKLLRFDSLRTARRAGTVSFGVYIERLVATVGGQTPPSVSGFLDAYRLENQMDLPRVERERRTVVEKLAAALSKDELGALVQLSLRYRAGGVRYGDYYRFLSDLCRRHGIDLARTPAFSDYVRYVLLSDAIDASTLLSSVRSLERAAIDRLVKRPAERVLLERGDAAYFAARLADFGLTPDEWADYRGLRDKSPVSAELRKPFEAFYEEADARSEMIVKKLLATPVASGFNVRGLIVGGFHTPTVSRRLRELGFDVAVLQPSITKIDGLKGTEYLSVFTREKAPLDRLLAGEKLFLAPSSELAGSEGGTVVGKELLAYTLAAGQQPGKFPRAGTVSFEQLGGSELAHVSLPAGNLDLVVTGPIPAEAREVSDGMTPPDPDLGLPDVRAILLPRTSRPGLLVRLGSFVGGLSRGSILSARGRRLSELTAAVLLEVRDVAKIVTDETSSPLDAAMLTGENTYALGETIFESTAFRVIYAIVTLGLAGRPNVRRLTQLAAPVLEIAGIAAILREDTARGLKSLFGRAPPSSVSPARERFLSDHTNREALSGSLEWTVGWSAYLLKFAPVVAVVTGVVFAGFAPGDVAWWPAAYAIFGFAVGLGGWAFVALTSPHLANNLDPLLALTKDGGESSWAPVPKLLERQIRYRYVSTVFAQEAASQHQDVRLRMADDLPGIIVAMHQADPTLALFTRDWAPSWARLLTDTDPVVRSHAAAALRIMVAAATGAGLSTSVLQDLSRLVLLALSSRDHGIRDSALSQLSGWNRVLLDAGAETQARFVKSYQAAFQKVEPIIPMRAPSWWLQRLQAFFLFFTGNSLRRASAFRPSDWRTSDSGSSERRSYARALLSADPTGQRFDTELAPIYRAAFRNSDQRIRRRVASEMDELAAQMLALDPTGRLLANRFEPILREGLQQTDYETIGGVMAFLQRFTPSLLQASQAMHDRWLGYLQDAQERFSAAVPEQDEEVQPVKVVAPTVPGPTGLGAAIASLGALAESEHQASLRDLVTRIQAHQGAENFETSAAPLAIQVITEGYEKAAVLEASSVPDAKDQAMAERGRAWGEVIRLIRAIRARPGNTQTTKDLVARLVNILALGGDIDPAIIRHMYDVYFNVPVDFDQNRLSEDDLARSTLRKSPKSFTGPKDLLGHILLDFGINRLSPNPASPINTFQIYLRTSKDSPAYAEMKLYLSQLIQQPFFMDALTKFDVQGRGVPPTERDQYWGAVRRLFKVLFRDSEAYHAAGMELNLKELTNTPEATVVSLTADMRRKIRDLRSNLPEGAQRAALDRAFPNEGAEATAAQVDEFLRNLDPVVLLRPAVSTIFSITKGMLALAPNGPVALKLRNIQEAAKILPSLPANQVRTAADRLRGALLDVRDQLPEKREKAPTGGRKVEGWRETTDKAIGQLGGFLEELVAERPASRMEFEVVQPRLAEYEQVARENNFAISPMLNALDELAAVKVPDEVLFDGVVERISDFLSKEVQLFVKEGSPVRNQDLSPEFARQSMALIAAFKSIQRQIAQEKEAADLVVRLRDRVTEINYLSNAGTANKFIQFRVDRWAVGISGKVAEAFGLEVENPADIILSLKENQALIYVLRHAQFRMPEHPLRQTLAAYFEALLRGKTRAEAGDAFRAQLERIYARTRPDLLGRTASTGRAAWYLDETKNSTLLSVPPAVTRGNLEINALVDPIDMLHLGWKLANSCLDIETGTHQEFAASYLLNPVMLTLSIQEKGAEPSKPALFRANFAFDPDQGTIFLLNGIRAEISEEYKEILGEYLRSLVNHLQKRADAQGAHKKISVFIPKKIFEGTARTLAPEETAANKAPVSKGGHQELTLGGGFVEAQRNRLNIALGLMPLHADLINVRIATYEAQEWTSPELEGWAYAVGTPVVNIKKAEPEKNARAPLLLPSSFYNAISFFTRWTIFGRVSEWKIALFAAISESRNTYSLGFVAAHPNDTRGQLVRRWVGFGLIHLGAVGAALAFHLFAGLEPGTLLHLAGILASLWIGNVATHFAWDATPLPFGRSILTPAQRQLLLLARNRSGLPADESALADRILTAMPDLALLNVGEGLDLRAQSARYLEQELRRGAAPEKILPVLVQASETPRDRFLPFQDAVRAAREEKGVIVNARVMPNGMTSVDLAAEAERDLRLGAADGVRSRVLYAVDPSIDPLELSELNRQFNSRGVRFALNDATLVFTKSALETSFGIASLGRINVFLTPNSELDPAAMATLRDLESRSPELANLFILLGRIAMPVTIGQLDDMAKLSKLVATQA